MTTDTPDVFTQGKTEWRERESKSDNENHERLRVGAELFPSAGESHIQ